MKQFILSIFLFINCFCLIAQKNDPIVFDVTRFDSTKTNYIQYRVGEKYGFMDIRTKKIVVPTIYDFVAERTNKYASVNLNDNRGVIDYNNRTKLPFAGLIRIEEKFFVRVTDVEGKKGLEKHDYYDPDFNLLFSFEADHHSVKSFYSNSIAYSELNKVGRIFDLQGKTIFEFPVYINFNGSVYRGYLANIDKDIIILTSHDTISRKHTVIRINTNKEVIPFPLDTIRGFANSSLRKLSANLFSLEKRFENGDAYSPARKTEYYLYDSLANQLNTEPFYNPIWNFSQRMKVTNEKGKYGFVNGSGKIVIPCKYSGNSYEFSENLAAFEDPTSMLIGFIDTNGIEIIKPKFHFFSGEGLLMLTGFNHYIGFHEGLCLIFKSTVTVNNLTDSALRDYSLAYVDVNGNEKIVLNKDVRVAGDFSDGLAPVINSKGLLGFINKSGQIVISFKYKLKQERVSTALPYFYKGFCKIDSGFIGKDGYEYFKN